MREEHKVHKDIADTIDTSERASTPAVTFDYKIHQSGYSCARMGEMGAL